MAAFEQRTGIRLPESCRTTIVAHQGQCPEPAAFEFLEHGEQTTTSMGVLFCISLPPDADASDRQFLIEWNLRRLEEKDLVHLVPFSEDPAGNPLVLDFTSARAEPSVAFLDHERGYEKHLVSPTFERFLESLHEEGLE